MRNKRYKNFILNHHFSYRSNKLYDHSRSFKGIEYIFLDPICGTLGDHCGLTPVDPSKYRACCDDFKCRRYNDSGLGTCVKMHPAGTINFRSIFL